MTQWFQSLKSTLLLCCATWTVVPAAAQQATSSSVDLQDGVRVERLADGFDFPEGPVWLPDGFLVFSDVQDGKIVKINPEGGSESWLTFDPPRKTNGMILSNDRKKIYAAGDGEHALLEVNVAVKSVRLVSKECGGRAYNSVNDIAVDASGHVFFTDPKWGSKPGDLQAVYRYDPADGTTTRAVELDNQPNGIVVSPDQKCLYVDRTGGDDVWRFGLAADGTLTSGAQWVKLDPKSGPDGMSIDQYGNLYVCQAGDGRVHVISAAGKTLRYVKVFPSMCTNCEFEKPANGGVGDGRVLYVTGGGLAKQKVGAVYKLTFPKP